MDTDSLNMHFAYDDEDAHTRHEVWYLDAVTAMNEMRAARASLESRHLRCGGWAAKTRRYGTSGTSRWPRMRRNCWPPFLQVPNVNTEGDGDVLKVIGRPRDGKRKIEIDSDSNLAVAQQIQTFPQSYTLEQYGYHPNELALTFDDGPDPTWTPKILDILKREHVHATFMVIGAEAIGQCRAAETLLSRRP